MKGRTMPTKVLFFSQVSSINCAQTRGKTMLSIISSRVRRLLSSAPFTKYLLFTNIVTCGVVDISGDMFTQKNIEHAEKNDLGRSGRMGLMGLLLGGPYHYWYVYLDKWYPLRRGSHVRKKVVLDICVAGPTSIAVFYLGLCKMEGKTWKESCEELKQKFGLTFMLDLAVWPIFQTFNFWFLPISLRLISANIADFGWAMVMSYLKHNDLTKANK